MASRIVISGLGTIGTWGCGRDRLEAKLGDGHLDLSPVDQSAGYHRRQGSHLALFCDESEIKEWVHPRAARRMSAPSRYALAATHMAIQDAGLPDGIGASTTVAIGTAFGTALFAERLVRDILEKGPESASPFLFSESVANAPAAQAAIHLKCQGSQIAVTQRESSAYLALIAGAMEIRQGRAERALVGGTDEVNPLIHAVIDRFRALAHDPEVPRPYHRHRNGTIMAEGASILVMEKEEDAIARGVRDYVRILGWNRSFDRTAPSWGFGQGVDLTMASIRDAVIATGGPLDSVDLIIGSASGSRNGDALEAKALLNLEATIPPVVTPKALVGEFGGGSLGAAIVLTQGAAYRQAGEDDFIVDPELGLHPSFQLQASKPRRTLVGSFAAGGAVVWLALEGVQLGG